MAIYMSFACDSQPIRRSKWNSGRWVSDVHLSGEMAGIEAVNHVGAGAGVTSYFQQVGVAAQDRKHDAGMAQAIQCSGLALGALAHP